MTTAYTVISKKSIISLVIPLSAPKLLPLHDRYGHARIVLAQRTVDGWRVIDERPRLARAA